MAMARTLACQLSVAEAAACSWFSTTSSSGAHFCLPLSQVSRLAAAMTLGAGALGGAFALWLVFVSHGSAAKRSAFTSGRPRFA